MEDFTQDMRLRDNDKVNEMCGCRASELTLSRRVLQEHHEDWCFYYMYIDDRRKELRKSTETKFRSRLNK